MKYLKLYENIDFDEWDEEEYVQLPYKKDGIIYGTLLSNAQNKEYYNSCDIEIGDKVVIIDKYDIRKEEIGVVVDYWTIFDMFLVKFNEINDRDHDGNVFLDGVRKNIGIQNGYSYWYPTEYLKKVDLNQ